MTNQNITIQNLRQFHGSENLHFNQLFRKVNYTDGVKWLGDNVAGWLQTDILAHLVHNKKVKSEEFVAVTFIAKKNGTATLTLDDGNDKILDLQKYEYVDFPIIDEPVKFFYTNNVLMLASEY
jgi:hypothetical protein